MNRAAQIVRCMIGKFLPVNALALMALLLSVAMDSLSVAQWSDGEPFDKPTIAGDSSANCDTTGCDELACCRALTLHTWLDGDQAAFRSGLEDSGVRFTNNLTNFYMGNTGGGLRVAGAITVGDPAKRSHRASVGIVGAHLQL